MNLNVCPDYQTVVSYENTQNQGHLRRTNAAGYFELVPNASSQSNWCKWFWQEDVRFRCTYRYDRWGVRQYTWSSPNLPCAENDYSDWSDWHRTEDVESWRSYHYNM